MTKETRRKVFEIALYVLGVVTGLTFLYLPLISGVIVTTAVGVAIWKREEEDIEIKIGLFILGVLIGILFIAVPLVGGILAAIVFVAAAAITYSFLGLILFVGLILSWVFPRTCPMNKTVPAMIALAFFMLTGPIIVGITAGVIIAL